MWDVGCSIGMIRGLPVVRAPEEIDTNNAGRLRIALLESATRGHATSVVDMSATRFCDSAGLKVLVRAHRRAKASGGELRLVIPSVTVLRVFAVTGMDSVIPHFATLDDALATAPAETASLVHDTPEPGIPD